MGIFSWSKKKDKARDEAIKKLTSKVSSLEISNRGLKKHLLELQREHYFEVRCRTNSRTWWMKGRVEGYFYRTLHKASERLCDEECRGVVLRRGKLVGYSFLRSEEFIESEGGIPDEAIGLYNDMMNTEEYWLHN